MDPSVYLAGEIVVYVFV